MAAEMMIQQMTTNSEQFLPEQFFANILDAAQRGDQDTQVALQRIAAHMLQTARDGNETMVRVILRNWTW